MKLTMIGAMDRAARVIAPHVEDVSGINSEEAYIAYWRLHRAVGLAIFEANTEGAHEALDAAKEIISGEPQS